MFVSRGSVANVISPDRGRSLWPREYDTRALLSYLPYIQWLSCGVAGLVLVWEDFGNIRSVVSTLSWHRCNQIKIDPVHPTSRVGRNLHYCSIGVRPKSDRSPMG